VRLLKAIEIGQIGVARAYIAEGDDVNEYSESGNCPLLEAASRNDGEMVELLLQNGANPDVHDLRNNTPLSWAQRHKDATMEKLIKTAIDNQEHTALRIESGNA
jgi:uncharacterized protein